MGVVIDVFYSPEMDSTETASPSAKKPALVAKALTAALMPAQFVAPAPVSPEGFFVAHQVQYVRDVLSLRAANGFGTKSADVARSLPYTTGAMLDAARQALATGGPCAALCSGFHHAGYDFGGGFCTFNGLMVTALTLIRDSQNKDFRVAIIDADRHYGNGTVDILDRLSEETRKRIYHLTLGLHYFGPQDERAYLVRMNGLRKVFARLKPDLILYQAGADAHRDDPLGGVLSTEGMFRRDRLLFSAAKDAGIPVAWNLAGGYQQELDGSIPKVLVLHLNTFRAAERYGIP